MNRNKIIVIAVVFAVVVAAAVFIGLERSKMAGDEAPKPIIFANADEMNVEIDRLEGLRRNDELSWQDTFRLGVAYLQGGRPANAVAVLEEAVEMNPAYPKTYESLGMAYFRMDDYDTALDKWAKALELDPDSEHLKQMTENVRRTKSVRDRLVILEEMLNRGEEFTPMQNYEIATLYMAVRRFDDAEKRLEAVLDAGKGGPNVFDTLAQIHALRGDYDKAIEAEQKALEFAPDDDKLKKRLVELKKISEGLSSGDYHTKPPRPQIKTQE